MNGTEYNYLTMNNFQYPIRGYNIGQKYGSKAMLLNLELRLPFLEHDLLEFALSLNSKSYFLNGKSKSVLRYAAKDYIDPRVRLKKKLSLQSPQNSWLKDGKIKEFINDIFHSKKFMERSIGSYKKVNFFFFVCHLKKI